MIDFTITLTGTAPLLMHNGRGANPLDPAAKAIKRLTGKRNKTDDDYAELARVEFAAGLYIDPDIGPYIPSDNILRCLFDSAKLTKMGVKVTRGVWITTDINPLVYDGPRDEQALWDAGWRHLTSAKNPGQSGRIMRCRPWFPEWKVQADGIVDPTQLDLDNIKSIADNAGSFIGLGDWRPRFGRFTATVARAEKAASA